MTLEHHSHGPAGGTGPLPAVLAGEIAQHLEANHRIANSLQLVAALLSSQRREVADPVARSALDISIHRIDAVAGVHRQLHHGAADGSVDVAAYLVDLVAGLQAGLCGGSVHRRLHLDTDAGPVAPEFATMLGVIVTELVINACKYAYAVDEAGDVDIAFAATPDGRFALEVRDRGAGRAVDTRSGGLGGRILELMARRLGAEGGYLAVARGTAFRIAGPLRA